MPDSPEIVSGFFHPSFPARSGIPNAMLAPLQLQDGNRGNELA